MRVNRNHGITWQFSEQYATLIPATVALEHRVFPIHEQDDVLVLLCEETDDDVLTEKKKVLEAILDQRVLFLSPENIPELEFNLPDLLVQHYGHEVR